MSQSKIEFVEDIKLKEENEYLKNQIKHLYICLKQQRETIEMLHKQLNLCKTLKSKSKHYGRLNN